MGLHPHSSHQKTPEKTWSSYLRAHSLIWIKYTRQKVKESEETCAQSCPPRRVYPASPSPTAPLLPGLQSTKHQETQEYSSSSGREKKISTARMIAGYFKLFIFLSHPQGINICRCNLDPLVPPPPATLLSYLCINMTWLKSLKNCQPCLTCSHPLFFPKKALKNLYLKGMFQCDI